MPSAWGGVWCGGGGKHVSPVHTTRVSAPNWSYCERFALNHWRGALLTSVIPKIDWNGCENVLANSYYRVLISVKSQFLTERGMIWKLFCGMLLSIFDCLHDKNTLRLGDSILWWFTSIILPATNAHERLALNHRYDVLSSLSWLL